jgi:hypothetical protein
MIDTKRIVMLERLVYVSKATAGVSAVDVAKIIESAHRRNKPAGLTGALLFIDNYFVQTLQGETANLDERYERIIADKRHCNIELRLRTPIDSPAFPNDWMALKDSTMIRPAMLTGHGYKVGFPQATFTGEAVLSFMFEAFGVSVRKAA